MLFLFLLETEHTPDSEKKCIFHFLIAWRSLADAPGEWLGSLERILPVCLSKEMMGTLYMEALHDL